ncbi:hypothetical protein ACFL1H_06690 [Nanoarchaeota archaeon]
MAKMKSAAEIAKSPMLYGILFQYEHDLIYSDMTDKYKECYYIGLQNIVDQINKFVEFNDDIYYCGKKRLISFFNDFEIFRNGTFSDMIEYKGELLYLYHNKIYDIDNKCVYESSHNISELFICNNKLCFSNSFSSDGIKIYKLIHFRDGKYNERVEIKSDIKHYDLIKFFHKNMFISTSNHSLAINDISIDQIKMRNRDGQKIMDLDVMNYEGSILDTYYLISNKGLYKARINVKNNKIISKEVIHDTGNRYKNMLLVQNEKIHNRLLERGKK